jgi:hypothetical protein
MLLGAMVWAQVEGWVGGGLLGAYQVPIVRQAPWAGLSHRGGEKRLPGPGFKVYLMSRYIRNAVHFLGFWWGGRRFRCTRLVAERASCMQCRAFNPAGDFRRKKAGMGGHAWRCLSGKGPEFAGFSQRVSVSGLLWAGDCAGRGFCGEALWGALIAHAALGDGLVAGLGPGPLSQL